MTAFHCVAVLIQAILLVDVWNARRHEPELEINWHAVFVPTYCYAAITATLAVGFALGRIIVNNRKAPIDQKKKE